MAELLQIVRAHRGWTEGIGLVVEVELLNAGDAAVGPGGLLMSVETSDGVSLRLSASNHWPLEPGSRVFLSIGLPRGSLQRLDFVGYAEAGGAVRPVGSSLVFGWLSSTLVPAETAPHV